jgi:cell division protein FtsB
MSSPVVQLRSRIAPLREAAVERARLRVVPRRRTRVSRVPFVVLMSMLMLGGVVGLLLFNTSMQQAAFATTALEEQAQTLTARQQTLEMELDVLRNPQRVAEQAQRMGMVPSHQPAYLELPSGKVLGEPAPAVPADGLRLLPRPPAKPAVLSPEPVVQQVFPTGTPAGATARADADGEAGTDADRNTDTGRARDRARD